MDSTSLELAGSSPRVRGKRDARLRPGRRRGLIPACAGKTSSLVAQRPMNRAHPRVCGENGVSITGNVVWMGSSPRVRGKRPPGAGLWITRGLIPACAGKTPHTVGFVAQCGAHPRVCGENRVERRRRAPSIGSSPRVRGKLYGIAIAINVCRLIPACAGKTQHR